MHFGVATLDQSGGILGCDAPTPISSTFPTPNNHTSHPGATPKHLVAATPPKIQSPTQAPQQNKEDVMKKQIVTTTAEPQWIVTARSLCHVQYRDGNQGGLPRIYPNARAKVRCLGGLEGGVLGPAQQPTGMLLDRVEGLPGLW